MKKQLLILTIIISSICTYSQNYEVPKDYKLVLAEDYAPYEEDVIKTVDWLIETPINISTSKRKEANAFLFQWISGSPKVKIELNTDVVFFECSDCLMVFLGGWTKDNILKNEYDNLIQGNLAGIDAVIEFYKKNKKIFGKDKAVEKFIKLKSKGKLEAYIEGKITP